MHRRKGMVSIDPIDGLPLVDAHCHIPWISRRKNALDPNEEYEHFVANNGAFIVSSSISWDELKAVLSFSEEREKLHLSVGWAPQTVTYTKEPNMSDNFKKWKEWIENNQDKYVAIGEIGLDFHHAKKLEDRTKQIDYFTQIIRFTKDFGKPYMIHVRNPGPKDTDRYHPEHKYNKPDSVNSIIVEILEEEGILPQEVMWHCFSGPSEWGIELAKKGYYLSVISSSYLQKSWRNYTKDVSIDNLLTETDSPFQHPYQFGAFNTPNNVKYSIAAIAESHSMDQHDVAAKVLENAKKFFKL